MTTETEVTKIRKTKQVVPYEDASTAAISAGITCKLEYASWYKTAGIPLPSHPNITYKPTWVSWEQFLGKKTLLRKEKTNLASYTEARTAAIAAGIESRVQYNNWYATADILLPSNPFVMYKDQWVSWFDFLSKEPVPYEEASAAAISAGITTYHQYKKWYNTVDISLPSHPDDSYNEWVSWPVFLGKREAGRMLSYDETKSLAISAGIKTSKQYLNWYKTAGVIVPSNPPYRYKDQWMGWSEFLAKPTT